MILREVNRVGEGKKNVPKLRFKGYEDAWEQRKLGEVFEQTVEYVNPKLENIELWSVTVESGLTPKTERYNREALVKKEDKFKLVHPGDVVYNPMNMTIGAVGMNQHSDSIAVSGYYVTMRLRENFNGFYFFEWLSSDRAMNLFRNHATGSLIEKQRVQFPTLSNIGTYVPAFLEQKNIGHFFQRLDKLITLHQRKYDALKTMKKTLLSKMFPKDGEEVPEIRFKGFTDAWEQRKLGDIADRFDNLRVPISAADRIPGETPYYGANGIQDYVDGYTHDGEFLLVAEDGANDLEDYPVNYVNGKIWVNNHAHVIQSKSAISINSFLMYAIKQIKMNQFIVGGSRAKLNSEVMMSLPITIPDIKEQLFIGDYFQGIDNLITLHQRKLDELKNMKKTLLQQVFV